MNEDEFQENHLVQDAVVRNIEIIGEAAKNLSNEIRKNNPRVEWRDIMRMRDKIAHHYFRVDLDTVWRTAAEDIPKLKPEIQKILDTVT